MHHNGKDSNWMMWVMMICCGAPLLLIIVFGLGGRSLEAPTWLIMGGIAVMVIVHLFMMGRSHEHSHEEESVTDGESKDKNGIDKKEDHSGHGCCH